MSFHSEIIGARRDFARFKTYVEIEVFRKTKLHFEQKTAFVQEKLNNLTKAH
jgi:hypothetical protein